MSMTSTARSWMCAMTGVIGLNQMRIVVNLPAYRIDVYVADSVVRSIPVAIGMPRFQSPRGSYAITSLEWNPWWIPPDSPWAAKEHVTRPGPNNPMGRVKLNFRPLYFLHGTPLAGSIGSAASHGCIRLRNADAIALARQVLRFGSPSLTSEAIDALATDSVTTRVVELEQPVPLELRYDLVELRAGRLSVYRDVYHLATRPLVADVFAVLAAHAVDTTTIDANRVRAFVQHIAPRGSTMLLDSLVRPPPSAHSAR